MQFQMRCEKAIG